MNEYIGKKVLVRSYDAGVYFGTLEKIKNDTCKVSNVRNIWRWEGASCLSQVANDGIKGVAVRAAGLVPTEVNHDFNRIDGATLTRIYNEFCRKQSVLKIKNATAMDF